MSELPMWFCNKCGHAGKTATRDEAREEHKRREPRCDYAPAWNWAGFKKPCPPAPPEWHPTRSREIL